MKRFLFSILPLLGGCAPLLAQQVSVDDAMQKARGFWQQNNGAKHAPAQVNPSLAYTAQIGGEVQFYVFNNAATSATADEGNGFVIIGGDERARQILGYCDHGSFDYETAPDNFKWWLSQYQGQIHEAIQNNAVVMSEEEQQQARRGVAPRRAQIDDLISTKWNQSMPYNGIVRQIGKGGKGGDLVTGCVATAMAQVMKKWKTPTTTGTGSHTYNTKTQKIPASANFAATTYDWANMLDDYPEEYTSEQGTAVAILMYHAGVSVDMDYNDSASGGSGASSINVPAAMSSFFGYDKSALCVNRDYYEEDEWEDLVYGELAAGRPLLYSGQSARGGHEFVCHGYNAEYGFYTFNWGWSGKGDGYYPLSGTGALQPNSSGIGGAGTGSAYTGSQDIVINLEPDHEGEYILQIYSYSVPTLEVNGVKGETANADLTQSNSIKLYCRPWNQSAITQSYQLGVMFRDVVSGNCFFSTETKERTNLRVSYAENDGYNIPVTTSCLIYNGTYEVYPAYRANAESDWQKMRVPVAGIVPTITVTGGEDPTPRDITFATTTTTLPERQTMQITHDKYYDGAVTYTSSKESVATVSETGLITAIHEGTATITAHGKATTYFKATSKVFEITITPFVKLDVPFQLPISEIFAGETATISYPSDYTGSVSYESSDQSVAIVDEQGVITGVSKGNVTITARAEGDETYKNTQTSFALEVKVHSFELVSIEVANQGYFTPGTVKIVANILNQTGYNYQNYPITAKVEIAGFTGNSTSRWSLWNNGETLSFTFDMSGWKEYFSSRIGKTGTITLLEQDQTTPVGEPLNIGICSELSYPYTMTRAGWGTLCLPFEAEIPAGLTAYACSSATNGVLNLLEIEGKMQMDTPYILSGTEGSYDFVGPNTPTERAYHVGLLTGVMVTDYLMAEGSYVLQMQAGKVGFYPIPASLTNTPATQYRAFLTPETTASMLGAPLDLPGDSENGIEEVEAEHHCEAGIYDLNGLRRESLQKGMNIIRQADGTALKVYVQ